MTDKHTPTPAITSNDSYSYYNQQEITGIGQPNSTVYLYDEGNYIGYSNVAANGTWDDNVQLLTGNNSIVGYDYNSKGLEGNTNTYSTYVNSSFPSSSVGPNISFDSNIKGGIDKSATLTGTVSDPDGVYGVFLYSDGTYIGAANVNSANGTWSYAFNQGAGDFNNITATAYDNYFNSSTASSNYELITGISGEPYKTEQFTYSPDGSVTNVAAYKGNGSLAYSSTYKYDPAGDAFSVVTGSGGNVTFASDSGDKKDSITNFIASGNSHDTLNLSDSGIHNMGQLLHHSVTSGGDTTIHLDSYSSITLDGVSKAQLQAHPGDFKFA